MGLMLDEVRRDLIPNLANYLRHIFGARMRIVDPASTRFVFQSTKFDENILGSVEIPGQYWTQALITFVDDMGAKMGADIPTLHQHTLSLIRENIDKRLDVGRNRFSPPLQKACKNVWRLVEIQDKLEDPLQFSDIEAEMRTLVLQNVCDPQLTVRFGFGFRSLHRDRAISSTALSLERRAESETGWPHLSSSVWGMPDLRDVRDEQVVSRDAEVVVTNAEDAAPFNG